MCVIELLLIPFRDETDADDDKTDDDVQFVKVEHPKSPLLITPQETAGEESTGYESTDESVYDRTWQAGATPETCWDQEPKFF
jgi:hypothetical protein